jgi:hypothetical protein
MKPYVVPLCRSVCPGRTKSTRRRLSEAGWAGRSCSMGLRARVGTWPPPRPGGWSPRSLSGNLCGWRRDTVHALGPTTVRCLRSSVAPKRPKTNRAESSRYCYGTARARPMSMRTASPSQPRHPATGSVSCSTNLDGHLRDSGDSTRGGSRRNCRSLSVTGWVPRSTGTIAIATRPTEYADVGAAGRAKTQQIGFATDGGPAAPGDDRTEGMDQRRKTEWSSRS